MSHYMVIFLISAAVLPGSAFADIYKCISPNGVTTYSDQPCSENAKVYIREFGLSVDDAIAEEIDIDRGAWSKTRREDNITTAAKRIAAVILPNVFFSSADVIDIKYCSTNQPPPTFERPTPHMKYDRIPGWEVNLKYHTRNKQNVYDLKFRFDSKSIKQPTGDSKDAVLLRTIRIKKNSQPFDPDTMGNVQHLTPVATGEWQYRQ